MRTLVFKFSAVVLVILGLLYFSGAYTQMAKAAIAAFSPFNCYTGSATTSVAYMTPGKATSTVRCNMSPDGARSAVIAVQVTASSTYTQYKFGIEESMDGIDYYTIRQGIIASTSPSLAVGAEGIVTYTFASSTTLGGIGGLTGSASTTNHTGINRNTFTLDIPVRMKFVRVWTALASTTDSASAFNNQNGAVWLQIIPRQDTN